jgi:branched-chain amino acid transport system substrate-binding protein
MRLPHIFLLLASIALSCNRASLPEPIVIGHIGTKSGDDARWGVWEAEGLEVAETEINSTGGILGRQLIIESQNDQGNPAIAVTIIEGFIQRRIQVVVGGTLSGVTLACAPVAERNKTVLVTPSAQNPDISHAGDFVFRLFASSTVEAPWMAKLAAHLKVSEVALLYGNFAYGEGLYRSMKPALSEAGIQVIFEEQYDVKSVDYRSLLLRLDRVKPSAVMLLGFPTDVSRILRQMKQLGIQAIRIAPNSFENEEVFTGSGGASEGVYYVYPSLLPSKQLSRVDSAFGLKYGRSMNYYNAVAYDAAMLLATVMRQSISESGQYSGEAIKSGLYRVKGYKGLSGNISIDSNGDVEDRPMEFRVVRNGKFEKIAEENRR